MTREFINRVKANLDICQRYLPVYDVGPVVHKFYCQLGNMVPSERDTFFISSLGSNCIDQVLFGEKMMTKVANKILYEAFKEVDSIEGATYAVAFKNVETEDQLYKIVINGDFEYKVKNRIPDSLKTAVLYLQNAILNPDSLAYHCVTGITTLCIDTNSEITFEGEKILKQLGNIYLETLSELGSPGTLPDEEIVETKIRNIEI